MKVESSDEVSDPHEECESSPVEPGVPESEAFQSCHAGRWGAGGKPTSQGKIITLALNKGSLESLWVVLVELEVGS